MRRWKEYRKLGIAVLTVACVAGTTLGAGATDFKIGTGNEAFEFNGGKNNVGKLGVAEEEETEAITEAVSEPETEAAEEATEAITAEETVTEATEEAVAEETATEAEETVTEETAIEAEETVTEETAIEAEETVTEGTETETSAVEETAVETEEVDIEEIPLQETSENTSLIDIRKVAKDTMPAIVAITNQGVETVNYFGRNYDYDTESAGSGIIVDQNDTELLIATNYHVVENANQLTVCFSVEAENEKDTVVPAQLKGSDASLDLAVIAVNLEDISDEVAGKIGIIQMGDSSELEVGEWVVAIGNSLGYGQSVTFGIVSALNREISVSSGNGKITNTMIQTDAAINFGNSGGALLDTQGRLIGINSAKAAETGVEGMGYAIPIDAARPIIEDLMTQTTRFLVEEEKAGILGVTVIDVSEEARELYNVPNGAYVYELTEGAGAELAGIQKGDIIVKFDQSNISSQTELVARLKYYEAGETVPVTVQRQGEKGYEELVIDVVLSKKSDFVKETITQNNGYSNNNNNNNQGNGQDSWGYGGNDQYYDQYNDLFDLFDMFGFGY